MKMAGILNRRSLLASGALAGLGALAPSANAAPPRRGKDEPFRYSLNTATISGQKLPITEEIDLAAKSGYDAIEPWIRELDAYVGGGGSLKDLRKRIADHGLTVPSAIGFASWIVDDDAQRAKGLEEAKRSMDLVAQIGGTRLAAPPVGATDRSDLDPMRIAERYRALLELGDQMGVVPELEVWGFSKTLNRLGTAALVAVESQHPKACVLSDVYHLYKGGSDFNGMKLLSAAALPVFHVNDYPAEPRDKISDAHRVYPGDGVAPLSPLLQDLYRAGFRGYLSLELFNRDYWKQDASLVAKTGLDKTRAAVRKAMKDLT
ncbi:MAG: sugar phosphate isomerase/epimerase family protein [Actinomycetota bacterium]